MANQQIKFSEEMYGRQFRARARMHQKSDRKEVRDLWKKPGISILRGTGGAQVSEAGKIREANIKAALTTFGAMPIARIKKLCGVESSNNDRLTISCLDRMGRDGVIEKTINQRPIIYSLVNQQEIS